MSTGFLIDIEGVPVGLVSHASIVPTYTPSKLVCLSSILNAQGSSFDPKTLMGESGAVSFETTDISSILTDLITTPRGLLDGDVPVSSVAPIDLVSTSDFQDDGFLYVGSEVISYSGKSATQLGTTSITRSALGSFARRHLDGSNCYGFNPFLNKRRVQAYRVDLETNVKQSLFTGYFESWEQNGAMFSITCLSAKTLILDGEIAPEEFFNAKLTFELGAVYDQIHLELPTKDRPPKFNNGYSSIKIDNELMEVRAVLHPFIEATVYSVPTTKRLVRVEPTLAFERGQTVDFVSFTGDLLNEGVIVTEVTHTASYTELQHTGQTLSLSVTDRVVNNYSALLLVRRGAGQTFATTHNKGASVEEVRLFGGTSSDTNHSIFNILMRFLFSLEGDGTNGANGGVFDVLPSGWGLGLSEQHVDFDSFQKVQNRSSQRFYQATQSIEISDVLRSFALDTNSIIFFSNEGKITCKPRNDFYPLESVFRTVDKSNINREAIPSISLGLGYVVNYAKINADYDLEKKPHYIEHIIHAESLERFGKFELQEIKDDGIIYTSGMSEITASVEAFLESMAYPFPVINVQVLFYEEIVYLVGDLVKFTFQHMANLTSGSGFDGAFFEIIDVDPDHVGGLVNLTLRQKAVVPDLCRVAPSWLVASVLGSVVTLKNASTTGLCPSDMLQQVGFETGQGGLESVDWVLVGDNVQIIDNSTLGGVVATHSTFISAVDYATQKITLNTVPAWLASDDIIRLDSYPVVKAGATTSDRIGVYGFLANANTPPDLSGDNANKWGV